RIGAETRLFDATSLPRGGESAAFKRAVEDFAPDLIAYSVRSNEWRLTRELLAQGAAYGVAQIVGGQHPTHAPQQTVSHVDALVQGEGEGAIMDIARHLAAGQSLAGIANTWVNTPEGVVATPKRRLIADLDQLPLPDWRLFPEEHYRRSFLSKFAQADIIAAIEGSRGCPYSCAYCSNPPLRDSYAGLGKWRREKSPERMVMELEAFREALGGLGFVYWVDEVWLTKLARLERFRDLYKTRIGVPFSITERPECITEEKLAVMADAGMYSVALGLESGDARVREEVLNRHTPADTLMRAFMLPREYGVKVHAFTMVGLPGQDEASMLKSWRFLRRVRPYTAQFSVFYPIPGTRLYDQTIVGGMFDPEDAIEHWFASSVLRLPDAQRRLIVRYRRLLEAYTARRGLAAVAAFHLYRKVGWAYHLRFGLGPKLISRAAALGGRLSSLYRSGFREATRKILLALGGMLVSAQGRVRRFRSPGATSADVIGRCISKTAKPPVLSEPAPRSSAAS
ncbi:MAG: radical SAM protein, partial [bacterium]|nr:radical SAM protein [bacterium]